MCTNCDPQIPAGIGIYHGYDANNWGVVRKLLPMASYQVEAEQWVEGTMVTGVNQTSSLAAWHTLACLSGSS